MFEVIFKGIGIDDNVVKVYDEEDIEKVAEGVVDEGLEGRRSVG